jgi:hypothetical protein
LDPAHGKTNILANLRRQSNHELTFEKATAEAQEVRRNSKTGDLCQLRSFLATAESAANKINRRDTKIAEMKKANTYSQRLSVSAV